MEQTRHGYGKRPMECFQLFGPTNFLTPGVCSDHSPCIVLLFQQGRPKKKSFKLFNMWANHHDFENVVRAYWNFSIQGTAQFILCRKLKRLKFSLQSLNGKKIITSRQGQSVHWMCLIWHNEN